MNLWLDLETYSPHDLKSVGVYKYCEDVEILLWAYAIDNGPAKVWDITEGTYPPQDLITALALKDTILIAHNSGFDRVVLESCGYTNKNHKWRCTMVQALVHSLPGGLDALCGIYGIDEDKAKIKDGRRLVLQFCKPQKHSDIVRCTRETHPEDWKRFVEYARMDIVAMREVQKRMPKWNNSDTEYAAWLLDQKINDRGFAVDLDLAKAAIAAVDKEQTENRRRTSEATAGEVESATQRDKLLAFMLEAYGVELPNMQISTLNRRLEDPDLPEPVKELILLRLQSAGTSTKKYHTVVDAACKDEKIRGTTQFCGAHRTGRFGGRIFQPHNLPRPKLKPFKAKHQDIGIEALKLGCADLMYDSVTDLASSCIRGVIVAKPSHKLCVSDWSSIEGRGLAWLAGEDWKLQAYRGIDAGEEKFDMYELAYANTFRVPVDSVNDYQRQQGKVLELALGYAGGVGAFVTFAKGYGINLEKLVEEVYHKIEGRALEEALYYWGHIKTNKSKNLGLSEKVFTTCDAIKRLWRWANPMIVKFWADLDASIRDAIENKQRTVLDHVVVDMAGSWLRIQLPSGRYLSYAGARIVEGQIKYLGINQYSRKWCLLNLTSGKAAENATQAFARDILINGLNNAEEQGYPAVLHVHDEIIAEVPDDPMYSHEELSRILSVPPPWASDLPLAAEGFESYRYRKG